MMLKRRTLTKMCILGFCVVSGVLLAASGKSSKATLYKKQTSEFQESTSPTDATQKVFRIMNSVIANY